MVVCTRKRIHWIFVENVNWERKPTTRKVFFYSWRREKVNVLLACKYGGASERHAKIKWKYKHRNEINPELEYVCVCSRTIAKSGRRTWRCGEMDWASITISTMATIASAVLGGEWWWMLESMHSTRSTIPTKCFSTLSPPLSLALCVCFSVFFAFNSLHVTKINRSLSVRWVSTASAERNPTWSKFAVQLSCHHSDNGDFGEHVCVEFVLHLFHVSMLLECLCSVSVHMYIQTKLLLHICAPSYTYVGLSEWNMRKN